MAILRWRFAADRCPSGSHLEPANDVSCSISDQRESADRFLFFLLRRVFVWVFRGSQGRSPRRFAGGLAATDSPDSPTNSSDEPFGLRPWRSERLTVTCESNDGTIRSTANTAGPSRRSWAL